jgi:hypothetical protein
MRNHWLRKKVAKDEFLKCTCRIYYRCGDGSPRDPHVFGYIELPLQLRLNWTNSIRDYLYIQEVTILDKNNTLIWSQSIASTLRTDAEIMLDFDGLFINGYKAKELFK